MSRCEAGYLCQGVKQGICVKVQSRVSVSRCEAGYLCQGVKQGICVKV